MERLTMRDENGDVRFRLSALKPFDHPHTMGMEKLFAYEDAEEQGLLVRLLPKVGDMVYLIDSYSGLYFSGVATMRVDSLATVVRWVETGAIGRTIFLSEEEAEAALAKE